MLRSELKYPYEYIVGESPGLIACLKEADKAVDSDVPVLIIGESGTGKELLAKSIWQYSSRKSGNFVGENCAAVSEDLLELEIFGVFDVELQKRRRGRLQMADKGILLLSEGFECSLNLQRKIMKAFQSGSYLTPTGRTINFDTRLISEITDPDFLSRMKAELEISEPEQSPHSYFDKSFYDYISQIKITIPPLRERKEDIPALVHHLLEKIARNQEGAKKEVSPEAMELLQRHDWPGNVRELENECTRIYTLSEDRISIEHLNPRLTMETFRQMISAGIRERIRSYFAEHLGLEKQLDALADYTLSGLDLRPAEAAIIQIQKMDGRIHIPKELIPHFIAYYQEAQKYFKNSELGTDDKKEK